MTKSYEDKLTANEPRSITLLLFYWLHLKTHSYQTTKVFHIKKAFFFSESKRNFLILSFPIFIKPPFYFIF